MLLYVGDFLDFKGIVFYFSLKLCVKNPLELAFRRKLVLYCIEGLWKATTVFLSEVYKQLLFSVIPARQAVYNDSSNLI